MSTDSTCHRKEKRARPDRACEPVSGMEDKVTDSRARQARCASTDKHFRHSNCCESVGARALALRFSQAGGREWQVGCPERTLVPLVDVRHFQFLYKEVQMLSWNCPIFFFFSVLPFGSRRLGSNSRQKPLS